MTLATDFYLLGPQCNICGLHNTATRKCMPGMGSKVADFVFIQDTPARVDAANGFVWSDRKVDQLLVEANLTRDMCYFTTLVRCAAGKIEPTEDQISACMHYLLTELSVVKPKVIFVSGKASFQALTKIQFQGGLGTMRGKVYTVKMPWGDCNIIPTWNIGFANYKSAALQEIIADVMMGIASLHPPRKVNYMWINDPRELRDITDMLVDMHENKKLPYEAVATDIESSNKIAIKEWPIAPYYLKNNIASIQVAWDSGQAFCVPVIRKDSNFNNPMNIGVLRDCMRQILALPTVGQNYKFDESYFAVKLNLRSNVVFDTMLAHHFYTAGSLPSNLDFMISRYLGWFSHKKIIEDELAAMPEEERSYALLSQDTLLKYGCGDSDATLMLYPILRDMLKKQDYSKYRSECVIIYDNMYTAFMERVMKPWRAIIDIELRGAKVDKDVLPQVADELMVDMTAAKDVVLSSPVYPVWIMDKTQPNPKRKKPVKASAYFIECAKCEYKSNWTIPGNKGSCPQCGSDIAKKRRMVETGEYTIDSSQPETIFEDINLNSPIQVADLLYNRRYLGFPNMEGLEGKTDKHARAALLDWCEKIPGKEVHAAILIALGKWNKASKLYSSYATKIADYFMVMDSYKSTDVTSEFELDTGAYHIHTNYYQDGTVSGRLSTRKPSLHTIPRESRIKSMFISRFGEDGLIMQADLSQAEVRAFVVETDDDGLRDAFIKGLDPYIGVAAEILRVPEKDITDAIRQDYKSVVLGLLYGRGPNAIADQTKRQVEYIKTVISGFFAAKPKLSRWYNKRKDFAHRHKCAVSRFGRIRPLVDQLMADDFEMINHAENIAINHPIQGMVGDLCVDSVSRAEYHMRDALLRSVIFNTVHDSVIIDVYIPELLEVARIIYEEMYSKLNHYYEWINVPFAIDMDLGTSWGDKANLKFDYDKKLVILEGKESVIANVYKRIRKFYTADLTSIETYTKKDKPVLRMGMSLAAIENS